MRMHKPVRVSMETTCRFVQQQQQQQQGAAKWAGAVGTKLKVTDKFSAYGKWENIFQDSDDTRDWKVEVGTKYKF